MNVIRRNLASLLLGQVATWAVSILLLIAAPRHFGDAAIGQVSFAIAYMSFFELVAQFGTGTFLTKVVARDTDSMARYVVNTLTMKLVLGSGLIALALGLAAALGIGHDTFLLICALCPGMLFNTLNNALTGGLYGLQRMGRPTFWDVGRAYLGGALGLAVILSGGSLLLYAFSFSVASMLPLIANLLHLWPELKGQRKIDTRVWNDVLRGGFPFFILAALVVLYGTIDVPILQAMSGSETVGWYTVAMKWVSMPVFIAASVSTAFFPALSADGRRLPAEFARKANRALHFVLVLTIPAAVGIALIADQFLALLYRGEFQQAAPLMKLLAPNIPILALDIILGSVVVAADRQRQWMLFSVLATIFNPLANIVTIPLAEEWFNNGAIASAVVSVVTEVILMVGAIYLRPEGVLDRRTVGLLGRTMVAAVPMAVVVVALGSAPLGVRIVAGMVVYGIASLVVGAVSVGELRALPWPTRRRALTVPVDTATMAAAWPPPTMARLDGPHAPTEIGSQALDRDTSAFAAEGRARG
jgi:O-antigen/teichoic acid export membrane protein